MTFHFNIYYKTKWGEHLCICNDKGWLADLQTTDGNLWTVQLPLETLVPHGETLIKYRYTLCNDKREILLEEPHYILRQLSLNTTQGDVTLFDEWQENKMAYIHHTAFTENYFTWLCPKKREIKDHSIVLRLYGYVPKKGEKIAVAGNSAFLGAWNISEAPEMTLIDKFVYELLIPFHDGEALPEYKYVLLSNQRRNIFWENGDNRTLPKFDNCLIHEDYLRIELQRPRLAGIVIPLFSLRSEHSAGIGDIGDLQQFISWTTKVGMNLIQLLPINDTTSSRTWHDSYPYSCVSVFAIHPIYADLRPLVLQNKTIQRQTEAEANRLNALDKVDYEAVLRLKEKHLRHFFIEKGKEMKSMTNFNKFIEASKEWLIPYCVYSVLRDKFNNSDFSKWGKYAQYSPDFYEELKMDATTANEMYYYIFVQFILYRQMRKVHRLAQLQHVILKGDLPIGVNRDSVSAWVYPELFNFDEQTGAPPDAFAKDGQNWGFPTYNWKEMAKNNYAWWRSRLNCMAQFFDAFRIDHVLGFFRIWAIPEAAHSGLLGHFSPALPLSKEEIKQYGLSFRDDFVNDNPQEKNILFLRDKTQPDLLHPRITAHDTTLYASLDSEEKVAFNRLYEDFFYHRHNSFWANEALRKLPIMTQCKMLPCAEDLGMVPEGVRNVLQQLQILTLEIQRMPKTYGRTFDDLSQNPFLSVSTIATHDMPPLRKWWKENPVLAEKYAIEILHIKKFDSTPSPMICQRIIEAHLNSPSMICALSFQDWLSMNKRLRFADARLEQINDPANPNQYWRYRMHLTLETLLKDNSFNDSLQKMIKQSGRGY